MFKSQIYLSKFVFLFFLLGAVFIACQKQTPEPGDLTAWVLDTRSPKITKRIRKINILEDILFLNTFYQRFDSLKTDKNIKIQRYRNNLKNVDVIKGTKKERRKYLELQGKEVIFSIDPESELVNIQSENLNLLEMEMDCDRDAEIKVYMVPLQSEEKLEKGWYGSFISQKFFPKEKGRKFHDVIFDLSQRFGWEKKYIDHLNVKVMPVQGEVIRVRLKNIAMLSHKTKLYEKIPSKSYHRYGGSARKRLESIFLPAGTEITYVFQTHGIKSLFLDGYLGSVDGQDVRFELSINGKSLINRDISDDIVHFSDQMDVAKKRTRLSIQVHGESGRIGFIGNMSVHQSFPLKRNVIFYLIDALRADKGSIQQDLFAKEFQNGAVFTHAYSNATRTADSIPSLFSGRYKFTLVEKDVEVPFVSNKDLLLAEYFKAKGYTTAAFTNNPWPDLSNCTQGFDHIYFCWSPIKERTIIPSVKDYFRFKYGEMKSLIDDFIQKNRNKPVFIYIHTMETHVPYEVPSEMRYYSKGIPQEMQELIFNKFSKSPPYPSLTDPSEIVIDTLKNLYKDAVVASYEFFKEMDRYLREENILNEHSLLIFGSDHGERFYEHKSWIHGPPDIYNEVIRIPLMIKGENIKPGIYSHNVQLLDIYPTILDWFGDQNSRQFAGISLIDYTNGSLDNLKNRIIYVDGTQSNHYAFIRGDLKIILRGKNVQIFDLSKDPQETQNLVGNPEFEEVIEEAKSFRERFDRLFGKGSKDLSAEEIERLRSLGYIK